MRWFDNMGEAVKKGIRSWLNIMPASGTSVVINETMDFEMHSIRNRIWYRGDSNELEQFYRQSAECADKFKFWAAKSSYGMEMRKIHTGLPSLIVRVLSGIILEDMNGVEFKSSAQEKLWEEIDKKNGLNKKLKKALRDTLFIGDGAWKITINTKKSQHPILRWYPGDRVDIVHDEDELQEVIFKTEYEYQKEKYLLLEHFGFGYVSYELIRSGRQVALNAIPQTQALKDYTFNERLIMAVPMKIYESAKYEGRGGSIFDGKLDNFDAFDEAWSQWMDALRAGRARTYIPESLIPRNPESGEILKPNPFDNRYIKTDSDMSENSKNVVDVEQPDIPHESYQSTYCTALDLCLQGIISPSTLGIDIKKLDNADAQREKEKATLYTRNDIIEALSDTIPLLIQMAINAYQVLEKTAVEDVEVNVKFGEYANPSFESQVETVSKGKTGGIMSIEASVDELYGDTRDEKWKAEEVVRLKAEQGIVNVVEPAVNLEGVNINEGEGSGSSLQHEPKGVPGTAENSQ